MHRMLLEVLGHKEGSQAEDALVRRLTEAGGGSGGPRVIQTARLVWGGSEGQCTRRWGVTTAVREVARHAREEDFLWQGRGGRREVPPHPWGLHSLSPTSSLASSLASSSCRPPSRPSRGCARQQVLCDSRNSTTCSNMDRRNLGWGGVGRGTAPHPVQETHWVPPMLCVSVRSPAVGGAPLLDLDTVRQEHITSDTPSPDCPTHQPAP